MIGLKAQGYAVVHDLSRRSPGSADQKQRRASTLDARRTVFNPLVVAFETLALAA
jgi:hypothetical protein